jgi:hypothetical protein
VCSPICEPCLQLICYLLSDRPVHSGGGTYLGHAGGNGRTHGDPVPPRGPLTVEQKLAWVHRYLPLTVAVMDLDGVIAKAEREPGYSGHG